ARLDRGRARSLSLLRIERAARRRGRHDRRTLEARRARRAVADRGRASGRGPRAGRHRAGGAELAGHAGGNLAARGDPARAARTGRALEARARRTHRIGAVSEPLAVGIDLGTTHTVVAFGPVRAGAKPEVFELPQLVGAHETE